MGTAEQGRVSAACHLLLRSFAARRARA